MSEIVIVNRWNGAVIVKGEAESIKALLTTLWRDANLQDANLQDANLQDANLKGAHLQGANLQGANLDYSAWPLQCSSTKAILDDRLKAQLLYHALCLVGDSVVIPEEMKTFVNSNFHRIGECPKL